IGITQIPGHAYSSSEIKTIVFLGFPGKDRENRTNNQENYFDIFNQNRIVFIAITLLKLTSSDDGY
ncbi:MAG: hypothetical protein K2G23_00770, partial [Muribaculaceae bacterium]|nr:hypothetical protein [Muribaculaceae bacterium]